MGITIYFARVLNVKMTRYSRPEPNTVKSNISKSIFIEEVDLYALSLS